MEATAQRGHEEGDGLLATRERQRLDTRERIYAVAEAQIRAFGVAGTRVSTIARLAGVSRQTVYDHFPSMDDVVAEALTRYQRRVEGRLADRLPERPTLNELLHAVVDALFGAMDRNNSRLREEMASYLVRGSVDGRWSMKPLLVSVCQAVESVEHLGAALGSLEAEEVARILLLCMTGFLIVEGDPLPARTERAHVAVELLLSGMR
jgi:AcrR family transcriptional regulator